MATADESTADVRVIRELLRKKLSTGLLPFFQCLTWAPQDSTTRPLRAAGPRLLIGSDASDGRAIYANYIATVTSNKVIAYYKDGSPKELHQYALDTSVLEAPFRYLMELQLANKTKHNLIGAYVKASFSLKGVTRDIAYELTGSFKALLVRAVAELGNRAAADDIMSSTSGEELLTRSAASLVHPLTSASASSKHSPPTKVLTRRRQRSSSSASQASEDNTIDFDEGGAYPWKRTLVSDITRTESTSQFGMFSTAKPHSRPRKDGTASPPIDSPSVNAVNKHKSLGMFSSALSVKRVKMGSGRRNRFNGESLASNAIRTSPVDLDPMYNHETLFTKNHTKGVRLDSEIESADSLAIRPNSGLDRTTREKSTNSSLSSPSLSPIDHENEKGLVSLSDNGTTDTEDRTESFNLDKQAQDYLEMETFIDHGGARIAILEKKLQIHLSKQTTSEEFAQSLEQRMNALEEQFEEEGITRRAEVRKRLESQIAAEIAAIDEDIGKKIALGTAKIHNERSIFVRSITESLNMRRVEEAKIKEEQRIVAETRERLQALKKAGGFDLGEVVNTKRQRRK